MAINYANLFAGLGELVQRAHRYDGLYAGLDTDLSEISSDFNTIGRLDIFSGMPEIFDGFKANLLGWIGQINGKAVELLTERDSVLEQLNLTSEDSTAVLIALYRDMVDQSQTINRSTVTVGSVTDDKSNSGAGSLLVDKILDGTTAPGTGMAANWEYDNVNSELSGTETMFAVCTSDSETDGATEGGETFQLTGQVSSGDLFSAETFGSGSGPTIRVMQGDSLGTNLEMEAFTSNVPDGWTLDTGTAGTHVFNETTTTKRGDSALRLTGNASLAAIQLTQAIDSSMLPKTKYVVGFWIQGNASLSAGTLTIQFEGTGYTAGSTEKISLNLAALQALTTYGWKYFFVNLPDEIPDDMELVIKFTGTPSAHSIYIDGGGMVQPVWHNGVSFAMYAGSEPFIRNDRFTVPISNNDAGVFQKWFRKALGMQMPSSGAPTIADSLAT